MSWSKSRSDKGGRAYHHGNLPDELVRAALELIAEKGPVRLHHGGSRPRRRASRPPRPTAISATREDLMAEVARRGFDRLAEALETAWDDGRAEPGLRFRAGRPGLSEIRPGTPGGLCSDVSKRAFPPTPARNSPAPTKRRSRCLRRASEVLCQEAPAEQRPPALMVSLHIWSVSHGHRGRCSRAATRARRKLPMAPEELLEAAILIYLRGPRHSHSNRPVAPKADVFGRLPRRAAAAKSVSGNALRALAHRTT